MVLGLNGAALNGGKIYVGVAGQDPETSPQPVFWDPAATIPAVQPLSVMGGYIMRAGSPARAYVNDTYSMRVRDSFGAQVYDEPVAGPSADALGAAARDLTNVGRFEYSVSLDRFGAVGGNASQDGAAMLAAYEEVITNRAGGEIIIPPLSGGALALPPQVIEAISNGTTPLRISGQGRRSCVTIAEACDYFFDLKAGLTELCDFTIADPLNVCAKGFICTSKSSTNNYPIRFSGLRGEAINGLSTAYFWENLTANAVEMWFCDAQNTYGYYNNVGDGVENRIIGGEWSGGVRGIRLDATVVGTTSHQPEGFSALFTKLKATSPGGIGIEIKDSLLATFVGVHAVLNGSGGHGLKIDASDPYKACAETFFDHCYLEGTDTGAAIHVRGNVRGVGFNGGGMGTGPYTTPVDGVDIQDATGVSFSGFKGFVMTGRAMRIVNSSDIVIAEDCDFSSSGSATHPNIDSGNTTTTIALRDHKGAPLAANRSAGSDYPNASASTWNAVVTNSGGSLTSAAVTQARYTSSGRQVRASAKVTITTNGSGGTQINVTLPRAAVAGVDFIGSGILYVGGVTTPVTVIAQGGGVIILKADGSYPGSNGAIIEFNLTYEAAS